jgi:hypothetical protein
VREREGLELPNVEQALELCQDDGLHGTTLLHATERTGSAIVMTAAP